MAVIRHFKSGVGCATDFVELLQLRADRQPDELAYVFLTNGEAEKKRLTYGELDAQARAIAADLQRKASPGDRALLVCASSQNLIPAFFGCLYAAVIAVPVPVPRPNRRSNRVDLIARNAGPALAITEEALLPAVHDWFRRTPDLVHNELLVADHVDDATGSDWFRPDVHHNSLAFLQYTSGSTATPRGVMVTHDNLIHNCADMAASMQPAPNDVIVSWLPLFHDMGLIGQVILAIYIGKPCVLMPPAMFIQRPLRWLQAINRYRGTISFAPDFAYDTCVRTTTTDQRADLDLSSWRVALNGAETVRAHTIDRFTEAFAPCGFRPTAFYPAYGLAEATLWVSGGPAATRPATLDVETAALEQMNIVRAGASPAGPVRTVVACGEQYGQQEVAIVDALTGIRCPGNRIGEIWVRGPSVAAGYWEQPEESAATFQAQIAETNEGPFLRTGDLGFVDRGSLYITGRIKDLIIIHGRNIYPQDIERETEKSHPSVRAGAVAAFSLNVDGEERLAVMLEVKRTHRNRVDVQAVIRAVRRAIAGEFEIPPHAIGILRPGSMPRTPSGKHMRRACRQRYIDGDLPFLARWTNTVEMPNTLWSCDAGLLPSADLLSAAPSARRRKTARGIITREVARLTNAPGRLSHDESFIAMGLDSLMIARLAHNISRHLPPSTPCAPASLFEHDSIGALADHLADVVSHASAATISIDSGQWDANPYRASIGQQRLWFLGQWTPQEPVYNLPVAIHFPGQMTCRVLRQAITELVARHEVLRTVAVNRNGLLFLHVRDDVAPDIPQVDIGRKGDPGNDLAGLIRAEIRRPFDLGVEPPVRFLLIHVGDAERVLLMTAHHTSVDAISLNILTDRLLTSIEAGTVLTPAPEVASTRFREYAQHEHRWIESREANDDLNYWQEQLRGVPLLDLPCDRPRPAVMTHRGSTLPLALNQDVVEALRRFCRREEVTPFMCLTAALYVLLARYSGQSDITIGTPVSVRPSARFESVVGHLVNMLALRVHLVSDWTVHELLRNVRAVAGGAYVHQATPFDQIVQHVNPCRDPSRTPFFQTVLALQPNADALEERLTRIGATRRDLRPELGVAQFDLTVDLVLTPAGIRGFIEYNGDLFDEWRIRQFATHYETCLRSLISNPNAKLSELDILAEQERKRLLVDRNAAAVDVPGYQCLPMLIAEQAERTPDATAVQCGDRTVTYATLMSRINRLAGHLRRLGVERESIVGVCMDRSIDMVVSLLAILRAGGAYIPMDPGFPPRRLGAMIDDASPVLVLSDPSTEKTILAATSTPIKVLCPYTNQPASPDESREKLPPANVSCHDLAYVIYTSGSTGKPKGVQIEHGSLVNLLQAMRRELDIRAEDALLAVTTISFDIAALELFLPLVAGGRVIVAPRAVATDGIALATELARTGATVMQGTPATWRMLLMSGRQDHPGLTALCGGEALPVDLAEQIKSRTRQMWNLYGPTETTIWSSIHNVRAAEQETPAGPYEPIGHPIANTRFYILDELGRPVPDGICGELFIGGAGVARGYLNRPGPTEERFVPDPFDANGGRLYRTGDLVRCLPPGNIEFLGRADLQVKVRGTRIEPGEVELALCELPDIEQAVVMARTDRTGENLLVAYLCSDNFPGSGADIASIRRHLQERLPDYMIPTRFVRLPAFPMTLNKKIDRHALPEPEPDRSQVVSEFGDTETELERMVLGIWAEVLEVPEMGRRENFFDQGGHSLLLVQVQAELMKRGYSGISVVDLFRCPTVESLAAFLDGRHPEADRGGADLQRTGLRTSREAVARRQRALRESARLEGSGKR